MGIRKYIALFVGLLTMILVIFVSTYQYSHSKHNRHNMEKNQGYFRLAKTKEDQVQLFKDGLWQDTKIKGIHLSSFEPGYGRNKTGIDKAQVLSWLEEIKGLGANVIKIPSIQPPAFYNAIHDFNEEAENPIYTIHEVMLDEKAILAYYDIYDSKLRRNFKRDIKNTINVVHGKALILANSRSHKGLYLKDISQYNMGYILGTNTSPEIITLTDSKYSGISSFQGDHFSLEEGSAFEAFVAESLDFLVDYELDQYKQVSLVSYLTDVETDHLNYSHEPNRTRKAQINVDKINDDPLNNLFISYRFHPSAVDFLDYEYENLGLGQEEESRVFDHHLKALNNIYQRPLILSNIGMSSGRGKSKVDLVNGFDRGQMSEKEQGEKIVELLKANDLAGSAGAIVHSWQDDWTSVTSFSMVEDYLDNSASSHWLDVQSSDESFGLMAFEIDNGDKVYVDGDSQEWDLEDYLIHEEIRLKVKSDPSFLYLLLEKEGLSLTNDNIYLGIDITPKSGSSYWADENASFSMPVDFIVHLNGYRGSRIVVNARYDMFNYLYKYYSHTIEKEDAIPASDSQEFSAIYLLNRKKFYFMGTDEIIEPIYYETGKLTHGNGNPKAEDYHSLTDFSKKDDSVEIKIPWTILNVKNPISMAIYDDFYLEGIEKNLKIDSVGFSIYDGKREKIYSNKNSYKIKKQPVEKYSNRLKKSYYVLQEFWGNTR